jgi:ribokinase
MMKPIVVLGVFVADATYCADRQPKMGETILGNAFSLGPGGKGSNQAVAIGRLNAPVDMLTRLGRDDFADMALNTWKAAGVTPQIIWTPESYTGAAYIFIEEATGNNAIIVCPGAARLISPADIEASRALIESASIFITQLEQPIDTAEAALGIAKRAGVTTILNTAPAAPLPDSIFALCDYMTPNETEVEDMTGVKVVSLEDAKAAANALLARGVGTAVITLGERGALIHNHNMSEIVPIFSAGPVMETTGAGDAFNGGFAVGLARGLPPVEAARFGCAVAGISVTRKGAASSMPSLSEAEALYGATLPA